MDEQQPGGEQERYERAEKSLIDELRELGRNLSAAIRAAFETEEAHRLQRDLVEAATRASEEARRMREQMSRVIQSAESQEAVREARERLAQGLNELNRELREMVGRFTARMERGAERTAGEGAPPSATTTADLEEAIETVPPEERPTPVAEPSSPEAAREAHEPSSGGEPKPPSA